MQSVHHLGWFYSALLAQQVCRVAPLIAVLIKIILCRLCNASWYLCWFVNISFVAVMCVVLVMLVVLLHVVFIFT